MPTDLPPSHDPNRRDPEEPSSVLVAAIYLTLLAIVVMLYMLATGD